MDTNDHLVINKAFLKRVLVYALASALMTIGLAWGISAAVGNAAEEEAKQTRELICSILTGSESQGIQEAVEKYCPGFTIVNPTPTEERP